MQILTKVDPRQTVCMVFLFLKYPNTKDVIDEPEEFLVVEVVTVSGENAVTFMY